MITLLLLLFGLTVLSVASLLTAWFSSTLPSHVFAVLQKLGFGKSNHTAWESFDEFATLDWQSWLAIHWSRSWLELFLGTLITCPICLSFHMSFWSSLVISAVTYYGWIDAPQVFFLVPMATVGAPILALILHNIFIKLEK